MERVAIPLTVDMEGTRKNGTLDLVSLFFPISAVALH